MTSPPIQFKYAVIFISKRTKVNDDYDETNNRLFALAEKQPGYLGSDSARNSEGFGITTIYWESLEAIKAWGANPDHVDAQLKGREKWYESYSIHICKVEHSREFKK